MRIRITSEAIKLIFSLVFKTVSCFHLKPAGFHSERDTNQRLCLDSKAVFFLCRYTNAQVNYICKGLGLAHQNHSIAQRHRFMVSAPFQGLLEKVPPQEAEVSHSQYLNHCCFCFLRTNANRLVLLRFTCNARTVAPPRAPAQLTPSMWVWCAAEM